ncbi:hypothetical protein CEXT_372061 [Caerostris extrusa]|uniref:Uncharacterized protein n=1 Tax=Caerostris extrusa TaxID=172846 RepID=A0AAV4XXI1_CAEEX|nr:hypothetical protein CEXT_372061 [Caerostris extrusa]
MLILLRTPINPVTCRSPLVLSRNHRSRRGIIYQAEVHANRDLAVEGTVVACPHNVWVNKERYGASFECQDYQKRNNLWNRNLAAFDLKDHFKSSMLIRRE